MKKSTTVRKHPRKTKTGRTTVKRHNRQFKNRSVKFNKSEYADIGEIHQDYVNDDDYKHPIPFTTDPKGSDMEMVLELPDNKREHHRIFDKGDNWKIESHIDQADPTKDPIGHYEKDVQAPKDNPKLRKENFNDTQYIELKKKNDK